MQDWTPRFNEARTAQGLPPVTTHTITLIHEGMVAGCGCPVISAGAKTFTIRHSADTCKYHINTKRVVGDGERNAVGSLFGRPDVLSMTEPWLGLFPHEQS